MYLLIKSFVIVVIIKSVEQKIYPIDVADQAVDEFWHNGGRRFFYAEVSEDKKRSFDLIHCQVLLTPFLTGVKRNYTHWHISPQSHDVNRFIYLIHANVTDSGDDYIKSILTLISRIKIRIFVWAAESVRKLLNHIIVGQKHSLTTLKRNLKRIFAAWKLDLSDTANLLRQSKIFRPPCLQNKGDGSTRHPKKHTFTPPEPRTTRSTCASHENN